MDMSSKKSPLVVILFLLAGFVLVWISPADKELGSMIKLIYLHGALVTAGLSLFTAAGLVSFMLLRKGRPTFSLLFAIEKTAIIFWVAATMIGDIASVLAWGGIFWGEPRFNATIIISLLSAGIYFISTATENPRVISYLGIGLAVSVWALMINAGRVLHPDNPFGGSGQSIRFYYFAITIVFLIASILTVRWMVRKER